MIVVDKLTPVYLGWVAGLNQSVGLLMDQLLVAESATGDLADLGYWLGADNFGLDSLFKTPMFIEAS